MKNQNITGLENAPKIMQDFVIGLQDKTKAVPKKPSFLARYRKTIIKLLQPIYALIAWFMFASILVASLVEVYYA